LSTLSKWAKKKISTADGRRYSDMGFFKLLQDGESARMCLSSIEADRYWCEFSIQLHDHASSCCRLAFIFEV